MHMTVVTTWDQSLTSMSTEITVVHVQGCHGSDVRCTLHNLSKMEEYYSHQTSARISSNYIRTNYFLRHPHNSIHTPTYLVHPLDSTHHLVTENVKREQVNGQEPHKQYACRRTPPHRSCSFSTGGPLCNAISAAVGLVCKGDRYGAERWMEGKRKRSVRD